MRLLLAVICLIANIQCLRFGFCPRKCYCGRNLVSCTDASNPRFQSDNRIMTVIMERCYVSNLDEILMGFRNLEYLTLKNMSYFNCSQLDYVSDHIKMNVDSCPDISSTQGKKNLLVGLAIY